MNNQQMNRQFVQQQYHNNNMQIQDQQMIPGYGGQSLQNQLNHPSANYSKRHLNPIIESKVFSSQNQMPYIPGQQ